MSANLFIKNATASVSNCVIHRSNFSFASFMRFYVKMCRSLKKLFWGCFEEPFSCKYSIITCKAAGCCALLPTRSEKIVHTLYNMSNVTSPLTFTIFCWKKNQPPNCRFSSMNHNPFCSINSNFYDESFRSTGKQEFGCVDDCWFSSGF